MSWAELAAKHGLADSTIQYLMLTERWPAKRQALERELFENWHFNIQSLQAEYARGIIKTQIESSHEFNAKIRELLSRRVYDCKDMQSLAQAFKSVADVAARAVGLERLTALDRQEAQKPRSVVDWNLRITDPGEVTAGPIIPYTEPAKPVLLSDGSPMPKQKPVEEVHVEDAKFEPVTEAAIPVESVQTEPATEVEQIDLIGALEVGGFVMST